MDVKKYLNTTTIIVGLAILFGVACYIGLNQHSKLVAERSALASQQQLNSIIAAEKHRLDSLATVYLKDIKYRDQVIASKDKQIADENTNLAILQDSVKHVLAGLTNVTADSSYSYISKRIKPTSPLKYPFDSTQVKGIHFTLLERDGLTLVNTRLNLLVADLKQVSLLKDNQIVELKDLNNVYVSKESICEKEKTGYQIEIKDLNKQLKLQKLLKNITIDTSIGLAVGVVILLLTK
jgi:hypothetical protein